MGRRDRRRPLGARAALAAAAVAGLASFGAVPPAGAAPTGPLAAQARPGSTVSPDGLTATDGQRTLRVARAVDLAPGGQQVAVSGSGYDVSKGIYVAFCLVTPPDQPPSPCGGGIDIDGTSGASAWISSNPPAYGQGLATPYGPGGTFSVSVTVSPVLAGGHDCRQVQCAIVSRSDHVRTADRSQDLLLPVRFASGDAPPPVEPAPSTTPSTLPPPPVPTTTAPAPAPEATLSADGRTATAAERTVTVSEVGDLDPAGTTVTVSGAGFDESKGVLVSLCRVAASPTEAPGPCLAGSSPGASRWVSSSPPDHAVDLVVPYREGGAFEVELDVAPVIDGETDCREVDCAVVVRRDDAAADDRTLDLAVPVAFGDERPASTTTATTGAERAAPPAPVADTSGNDDGGSGSALPWILLALVVVAAGGGGIAAVLRSRRPPSPAPTPGGGPT
ncbi:MAG TPA: hypothetical protein VEW93_05480 [Acidimicrobiales bacterium]|nr:hypothetical protein [Acidimicrobiales bacterium]